MKKRTMLILVALLAYLASYVILRKCYETREGELITLYDEDSILSLLSHLIHTPLIYADTALTGRKIKVGNWREPGSLEFIKSIEDSKNSVDEAKE